MRKKKDQPEATRLESVASGLSTGTINDYLRTYVNSAAVRVDLLCRDGERQVLDPLEDNLRCMLVLVDELRGRNPEGFEAPPDPVLQAALDKFFAKQRG